MLFDPTAVLTHLGIDTFVGRYLEFRINQKLLEEGQRPRFLFWSWAIKISTNMGSVLSVTLDLRRFRRVIQK